MEYAYMTATPTPNDLPLPKMKLIHLAILLLILMSMHAAFIYFMIPSVSEYELDEWPSNKSRDVSRYIHLGTPAIMPRDFCKSTFLVVIVHSSPQNFLARRAIRASWGHRKIQRLHNVAVYFLLGQTHERLQLMVKTESETYGDLVVDSFWDTYQNLTLKSVVMLKVFSSCHLFTFLYKCDDDTFIKLPEFVQQLRMNYSTTNVLTGKLMVDSPRITDIEDKWYAPKYMYPDDTYPDFLLGGIGYAMSYDVAQNLYHVALVTELLHIEDVFVTGICANRAGIEPTENELFSRDDYLPEDLCKLFKLLNAHRVSADILVVMATIMEEMKPVCVILKRI